MLTLITQVHVATTIQSNRHENCGFKIAIKIGDQFNRNNKEAKNVNISLTWFDILEPHIKNGGNIWGFVIRPDKLKNTTT